MFKPLSGEVKPPHSIFNIGNNQPVTAIDFIRTRERVLGMTARLDFQPMQPGDVGATHADMTHADTSKLQAWVGYTPGTALATGLTHFRDWYDRWPSIRPAWHFPSSLKNFLSSSSASTPERAAEPYEYVCPARRRCASCAAAFVTGVKFDNRQSAHPGNRCVAAN